MNKLGDQMGRIDEQEARDNGSDTSFGFGIPRHETNLCQKRIKGIKRSITQNPKFIPKKPCLSNDQYSSSSSN
jgi:hypothetical protein